MPEQQNSEWKESWRDEYLKWICGFANAEGGILFIGRDNEGQVKGITNSKKLLEDLPNKVLSHLGILVEVNLHEEDEKEYLEIIIEPYPYPVSYRGSYFRRSGSTLQELKGNALNKFLLERVGKTWDAVPVPGVKHSDLSVSALSRYRDKASKNSRIPREVLEDSTELLLANLRLYDGEFLKRAAILLFYPDPEKYISGAYVKIGFFRTDDDLVFQDDVHGSLMEQIDKVDDLLKTKYSAYMIEYVGISRVEKSLFPEEAVREALLNALAHKDYSETTPIQISVYPDHIVFWNPGELPQKLTLRNLSYKHPSIPFNPDIANGLFRCGDIESWGRGTLKMIKACVENRLLPPSFSLDTAGFQVIMYSNTEQVLKEKGFDNAHIKVMQDLLANHRTTNKRVQEICNVSKATATRYLDDLEGVYIERVGETGRGTYYKIMGS